VRHKIIGIAGYARVGKDTAADYIIKKMPDYEKSSFADPIKAMLKVGLGLSDHQLYGDQKEVVDERYNKTPRQIMQTLGTEWGRNTIDQNIWVQAMIAHIERTNRPTIIPDVRFESEAEMIRENGGLFIHVIGIPKINTQHSSESGLYFKEGDIQITNLDSLPEYYLKIDKLIRKKLK